MFVKSTVKYIQSLSHKKQRDADQVFVAEGPKLVEELLNSGTVRPKEIFATPEWAAEHARFKDIISVIDPANLERISFLATPNQVLGIFHKPAFPPATEPPRGLTLLLDTIQDPGNMGTIIRTADWFGIDHIICSPECADAFSPKVVQSTMGSISRVHVEYAELTTYMELNPGIAVYAAALDGENIFEMGKVQEGFLLIGNESKGISPLLLARADHKITIPGAGRAESLNASVATAIILAAWFR